MAKVGKAFLNIPDSFFYELMEKKKPQLQDTAEKIASTATDDANQRLPEKKRAKLPAKAEVSMVTNKDGRPTALVLLQHPSALALQAKYGVLTLAAAKHGVDVHRYEVK